MIEAILAGFSHLFQPNILLLIVAGVLLGLVVGVLPGISGLTAITMLLPIMYVMEPIPGLSLLLAVTACSRTGGSITTVLLNIPGDTVNAATLMDGYPMTQKGQGGRGVGAAVTASMMGGIFGGICLAAFIPVIQPIVLAFGSPETFAFIFVGILCIGMLLGQSRIRGLIAGMLGMLLSLIGWDPITATPRYTFDVVHLFDGLNLVPVTLGIFVIPQIMNLLKEGSILDQAKAQAEGMSGALEGFKDVFRHWWLLIRSSVMGLVIGVMPGIGGASAGFLAYAQAKQTSRHPEQFGTGIPEGVIAPESASNAEQGGAMMPTLAFGVPGNVIMAIMLGAFQIKGIPIGSELFRSRLDLVWTLVGALILATIIGGVVCILLSRQLIKMCFVPGYIMAPLLFSLCAAAAYSPKKSVLDIVIMVLFGLLGYIMVRFDYPRPAFLIGFILTPMAERFFHLSMGSYGVAFLTRPLVIATIVVLTVALFYGQMKQVVQWVRGKL